MALHTHFCFLLFGTCLYSIFLFLECVSTNNLYLFILWFVFFRTDNQTKFSISIIIWKFISYSLFMLCIILMNNIILLKVRNFAKYSFKWLLSETAKRVKNVKIYFFFKFGIGQSNITLWYAENLECYSSHWIKKVECHNYDRKRRIRVCSIKHMDCNLLFKEIYNDQVNWSNFTLIAKK